MTYDTTPGHGTAAIGSRLEMREGDDFVCPNCNCEIRLRRHGDPERMQAMRPFTCCCGTVMEKEQRTGA